ncbi:EH-domain containing protein, putative [Hondaea fermentalgiana]|uniref:EH-domain containing protein, putative n=1 Tax=Hondaea fermentalgiana TaxID=2315210 RepID=A0A2R5GSY8_9STRA|nr:EH-domain containing protein, putative [Hondaea fermentalgiana]|eukprot:GBG33429.1 EH-domain containing protein, putative [Hondaea fermentalgiana]
MSSSSSATATGPDVSHWVKDEFVLNCEACDTKFSMSVRKHHCRKCGSVFCARCAARYVALPELGFSKNSPQRVCESCYTSITSSDSGAGSTNATHNDATVEGLKRLYRAGIKPLEVQFKFGEFYSPVMTDADFDAKPMVLLIGQYSVGKTSFIRYLVGRDFPGQRIGPEPTTDRFTIVAGSDDPSSTDTVIPGNALAVQSDRPFRSLQRFGAAFLDKLECAQTSTTAEGGKASILKHITFVDTPGVLAGEKQRIGRSYDYTGVVEWFAGRCDRILLLFDAHKLDISDEFQTAIAALRGHDEKIRVVLNKADAVDAQQLMRVHGALMWSLGKIIRTPEVVRVYVGSFWDNPLQNRIFEELFRKESTDLIDDLRSLPGSAITRKVNEVVKRARAAKTHALIVDHLRNKLPLMFKEKALQKMLDSLENEYQEIHRKHGVPLGDFPRPETFRRALKTHTDNDLSKFPPLNQRMIVELNDILSSHLPRLHAQHTAEAGRKRAAEAKRSAGDENPFGAKDGATPPLSVTNKDWAVDPESLALYSGEFDALGPVRDVDGKRKIHGNEVRDLLVATGVAKSKLRQIWNLSDLDQDGSLTLEEFAIARHLIETFALKDEPLPEELPPSWMPTSDAQ